MIIKFFDDRHQPCTATKQIVAEFFTRSDIRKVDFPNVRIQAKVYNSPGSFYGNINGWVDSQDKVMLEYGCKDSNVRELYHSRSQDPLLTGYISIPMGENDQSYELEHFITCEQAVEVFNAFIENDGDVRSSAHLVKIMTFNR